MHPGIKLGPTANGVYAIAATPFAPDGAVDTKSVDRMTDFYLSCGVTGLTVLGIMGEAPKLDPAEALAISNQVVRRANVPVIVGVSAPVSYTHLDVYKRQGCLKNIPSVRLPWASIAISEATERSLDTPTSGLPDAIII